MSRRRITRKQRILWLEDQVEYVEFMRDSLEDRFEIVPARSIAEAVRLLKSEDVCLVIVDVSLIRNVASDTGGFDFVRKHLKANQALSKLPVVVLSAYGTFDRLRTAWKEYGVVNWLSKDQLTGDQFRETITRAIESAYPSAIEGETARVLVIDDNAGWRRLLRESLEGEGYIVDTVDSLQKAIDHLRTQTYRLMLVDIRMKDSDSSNEQGFDFLGRMRLMGLQIDTLVVTAYSNETRVRKAFEDFKAHKVFKKDEFNEQDFRNSVRQILSTQAYLVVGLEGVSGSRTFIKNKKNTLRIWSYSKVPSQGLYFTIIPRPASDKVYELEAVISQTQPDMMVLPSYRQRLSISSDLSSNLVEFILIPKKNGKGEVIIEFQFKGGGFRRLKVPVKIIDKK